MRIHELFNLTTGINRMTYFGVGSVLMVIKYNIDRLIALPYNKLWYFFDYFESTEKLFHSNFESREVQFLTLMLVTAIPFIVAGVALTYKRLLNAGLPGWLVAFFFVPFVNLLTFVVLCIIPPKSSENVFAEKPSFLNRVIPRSKIGSVLMAIGISVLFSVLLTEISIEYFEEYGWGLFIGIPFFSGLASVLFAAYHKPVTLGDSLKLAFFTVLIFSLVILAAAIEGIICLIMAAPIGLFVATLGSIIGYHIQKNFHRTPVAPSGGLLLFIPLLMFGEKMHDKQAPVYKLESAIEVNAAPETVWKYLVGFSKISPPQEYIFLAGISYPTHATITGTGVGAIRECHFTTGTFVEPITIWDEPNQLSFDVLKQPVPMTEWSFYENIETAHLHGYFKSEKGEFRLKKTDHGKTLLIGTTWYQNKLWPSFYWKAWSDYILHQIHLRVLKHIKTESELHS